MGPAWGPLAGQRARGCTAKCGNRNQGAGTLPEQEAVGRAAGTLKVSGVAKSQGCNRGLCWLRAHRVSGG